MSYKKVLFLSCVIACGVLCICPFIGGAFVDVGALLRPFANDSDALLLWQLRIPRVLTAFAAGMALSVAGAAFQAVFRNPLATPFTLGISSAASLGSVFYMRFGGTQWAGVVISAFLGAAVCAAAVYLLAWRSGGVSNARLLLAGVAVSFCCSSLIMFLHYASSALDSFRMMRHLMGSLSAGDWKTAVVLFSSAVLGWLCLWRYAWELDLLAIGDEIAQSRGVEVHNIRNYIFLITCSLEACVTAFCGPIAFVGLMVPHCCRIWFGGGYGILLPVAAISGGSFLLVCDTAARTIAAPSEMPVGVLTSLIGGVFFLWLLFGVPGSLLQEAG